MMNNKMTSIALFTSVLLNMFLAGIVVSCYTIKSEKPHHRPPPHAQGPLPQFETAKTVLSSESQRIVEDIIAHERSISKAQMGELRHAIRQAEQLLTAPTLDKDALRKIHKDMAAHNIAIKSTLSDVIYKIASELPDKERIAFFKEALPNHPPRGDKPPKRHR